MKRFFTKYGLPVLLAGIGLQASGEELYRYTFDTATDFTDAFTVQNKNEDAVTWQWHEYKMNGHEYQYAQCYAYAPESYNDWLTTQLAYMLKKGTAYRISFQGWMDSDKGPTTLKVGYVPTSDKEAFVELFSVVPEFPNKYQGETPKQFDIDFEVPEDGYRHFVFISEGSVQGGGSCIDNIVISENGSPLSPAASTAVTAKGDASFALKATVTFTLPEKTVTGADLPADGISKVEIYRGATLAGTITEGLTPGATLSWTDENAAIGENEYTVVAYNGDLKGAEVKTSVYVGPLTPFAPTNVTAKRVEGGKVLITWTAPTESEEGITLDDFLIGYNVYRSVNGGAPVSVAKNIFANEYEDDFSSDTMAEVVYSVEAVYGPNTSESVVAEAIRIGSFTLPFEESFADAATLSDWEFTSTDTSSYSKKIWERRDRTSNQPYAQPFDNDGGLLAYNSYSASTGLRSEAITPEIRIKNANNLILEFQFYHSNTSSYKNDKVIVKVSKDGGDFVELEDGTLVRTASTNEWKRYEFSLAEYADASTIRVAFEAISDYGADMAIDALRIYSGKAFDLKAQSLVSEPTAATGSEAEFKFTLKNVAFSEVKGEDYKVNVYADGSRLTALDGQDIAPQQTADFDFTVPVHAGHVEMGMPVYAEIEFANDEDHDNNASSEIIVDVVPYTAGQSIEKVNGKIEGDNLVLSWADVEVDQFDRVESEITLDREEDYISPEMFKEDNSAAWPARFIASDGQAWRNIDNDGIVSASEYSFPAEAKAFMFDSNEHRANDLHYDYSHEKTHGMLVAVAPDVDMGEASDYLISPMLPGKGNHRLEFMAKSYSSMTPADFYIEYTTESSYTAAQLESKFVVLGDKISIPYGDNKLSGTWMPYVFELPADAKYVAIHFVGKSIEAYDKWGDLETHVSILCIDNIKLVSEQSSKPVYNVYYREYTDQPAPEAKVASTSTNAPKRHNESELETAGYSVPVPAYATDFHVSCVYPEGETALSAPYKFNFSTGIESVEADLNAAVKVEGRNISAFAEGKEIKISVYAMDGSVVASDVYNVTVPAAGAYVVKAGARTVKIVVR